MFPRSHHQPSLITIPSLVQPVPGRDVKRWNFRKANWAGFTKQLNMAAPDLPHPCPNNLNDAYDSYCNTLLATAKDNIPHGGRKAYIPCWDEECEHILLAHSEAQTTVGRDKAADDLFCRLNEKRRQRWIETVCVSQSTSHTQADGGGRQTDNAPSLQIPSHRSC